MQAFGSFLFHGPDKARHDDHCLAVYERGGFVGAEADQAMAIVFMFVLGCALREAAGVSLRRRLAREGRDPGEAIRESIAQQTEIAMRFPICAPGWSRSTTTTTPHRTPASSPDWRPSSTGWNGNAGTIPPRITEPRRRPVSGSPVDQEPPTGCRDHVSCCRQSGMEGTTKDVGDADAAF